MTEIGDGMRTDSGVATIYYNPPEVEAGEGEPFYIWSQDRLRLTGGVRIRGVDWYIGLCRVSLEVKEDVLLELAQRAIERAVHTASQITEEVSHD